MVFFDVPISTNLFQADNKLLLVLRLDSMAYLTLPYLLGRCFYHLAVRPMLNIHHKSYIQVPSFTEICKKMF